MITRLRPFPARRISSRYGWRVNPGSTVKSFHTGDDYAVPGGSPVRATEPGTVGQRRTDRKNGHTLTVLHADGWVTKYFHLRHPARVVVGQEVAAGEILAYVGHTGLAAHGDHLHFEVWHNGRRLDPATYFQEEESA